MPNLSSIEALWVSLFLGRRDYYDNPRVPKSTKSWNLWFSDRSSFQIAVLKPRSAASTRNLRITCRGEDATSESNTPPGQISFWHTADFRRISTMFFQTSFKSVNSFSESFEYHWEHTFNGGTCQISARLKHSGYHFSWGDEIAVFLSGSFRFQYIFSFRVILFILIFT